MNIESKTNKILYKYRVPANMLPVAIGITVFCLNPNKIYNFKALTIGTAILTLAFMLRFWVALYNWKNINSHVPEASFGLITNGPYRYCRNPMYLSAILMVTGFSIIFNSIIISLIMIIPTILLHIQQIVFEEAYLNSLVGKEKFSEYKKKVPCLIPYKLKVKDIKPFGKPNWKKGIQNDAGPLFGGITFIFSVIILMPFMEYNSRFLLVACAITVVLNFIIVGKIKSKKPVVKEIPSTAPTFILTMPLRKWLFSPYKVIAKMKLSQNKNYRVLDLGCGPGFYTLPIAESINGKVVALDIRTKMLDILSQRALKAKVENIKTIEADSKSIPVEPQSFDTVLMFLVIGEIVNPKKTIEEVDRVLKKDGNIYILESKFDDHFQTIEEVKDLFGSEKWNLKIVEQKRSYYILEISRIINKGD